MIQIVIDSRLRFALADAPEDFVASLHESFTYNNPKAQQMTAMGRYHSEPDTISTFTEDDDELTLPRGGLSRLRDACDEFDVDFEIVDNRSMGAPGVTGSFIDPWQIGLDLFPEYKRIPWDHQKGLIEAALAKQQLLARSPTGSGKTDAVLNLISQTQVPSIVIMWDTGLLKQWQERIEEVFGVPPKEQGLIRGSTFRLRALTLAMQQTLTRWSDEKWARLQHDGGSVFGGVYCDEVQRYAASTFTNILDRFDCHFRVGVSADERRKDRKTFLIYDQFGRVGYEVKKKELVAKRIIHDVECYIMPTSFEAQWYVDALEAAKDKDNPATYDPRAFGQLLSEMEADDDRNALAVHLITEAVRAGLPSLSFTHYVDHARKIDAAVTAAGMRSGLALGGADWASTFDATVEGLREGTLDVGCGTFGKLGVGHDIPTVAAGVAVTPVHNNRPFADQVKGRICRTSEGKQNARIIVMWDRRVFGLNPLYNLKRWNEVCRVWNEWTERWQDVGDYIREVSNERPAITTAATSSTPDGLFQSASQVRRR